MAYGMEVYLKNSGGTSIPVLFQATPYNLMGTFAVTKLVNNPAYVPIAGITTSSQVSIMGNDQTLNSLYDVILDEGNTNNKVQYIDALTPYNGGIKVDWTQTNLNGTNLHGYSLFVTRT